jgi:hypothetical protein
MAKRYLIDSGYDDQPVLSLYEPDNEFWNSFSSRYPKMLEDYGLLNKTYHDIIFSAGLPGVRYEGATVFVDRNEKRVIGVLYGNDFAKNPSD